MNEDYRKNFSEDLKMILHNLFPKVISREEINFWCEDYTKNVNLGVLGHDGVLNTASAIFASKIVESENVTGRMATWRIVEKILYSELQESEERLLNSRSIKKETWLRIRSEIARAV